MARVLVTRRLPDDGTDPLLAAGHPVVARDDDTPFTPAELCAATRYVDAVVCLLTDHIDVVVATATGVAVCNTPGVLNQTTADLALLLILAASRLTSDAEADLRSGRWPGWGINQYLGHDVHGATLGLVGFGRIGRAVARRRSGFAMKVLHHTRTNTAEGAVAVLAGRRPPNLVDRKVSLAPAP